MKRIYPRWKYSRTHGGKIVHSAKEEATLPGAWFDDVSVVTDPILKQQLNQKMREMYLPNGVQEKVVEDLDEVSQLKKLAKAKGIKIHPRAGKEKILEALKEHGGNEQ